MHSVYEAVGWTAQTPINTPLQGMSFPVGSLSLPESGRSEQGSLPACMLPQDLREKNHVINRP